MRLRIVPLFVTACIPMAALPLRAQSSLTTNPSKFVSMTESNPLLVPSSLPLLAPEFGKVKDEHFSPAFEKGIKEQLEQVQIIADSKEPPSFENTLIALEKTGDTLRRVQAI
ncbi:MAG: hypothetical protein ACK5OC_20885, partial [Pirellula sp.]